VRDVRAVGEQGKKIDTLGLCASIISQLGNPLAVCSCWMDGWISVECQCTLWICLLLDWQRLAILLRHFLPLTFIIITDTSASKTVDGLARRRASLATTWISIPVYRLLPSTLLC